MLPGKLVVDYHKRHHTPGREDDGIKIERLQRILKLEVESRKKLNKFSNVNPRESKRIKRIKCETGGRTHITQMYDPSWKQSNSTATKLHSVTGKKSDKTHTVLLHTAQVPAEVRQRRTLARILFDGGIQLTFLTT